VKRLGFYTLAFILTAVMLATATVIGKLFPTINILAMGGAVAVAALSSMLAYMLGERGVRQSSTGTFMTSLSAGMMVKMIAGIAAILIVWLTLPAVRFEFVVTYFVGYVGYTSIVVYSLMHLVRQQPIQKNVSSAN
jgi:hypothetical protein